MTPDEFAFVEYMVELERQFDATEKSGAVRAVPELCERWVTSYQKVAPDVIQTWHNRYHTDGTIEALVGGLNAEAYQVAEQFLLEHEEIAQRDDLQSDDPDNGSEGSDASGSEL